MMLWLIAALGLVIGAAAGLLGAGPSLFTLLVLLHVARLDLNAAVTTALVVVSSMSLIALIPYARTRAVMWRAGIGFGLASMTGAYLGGRVAHDIPNTVLRLVFVVAMTFAGGAMTVERPRLDFASRLGATERMLLVALAGLLVGALTGTVGLGGGFAVVPLLVFIARAPMRSAVGTSLFVILMNTIAALAGHASDLAIDWKLAALVAVTTSLGSLVGAKLSTYVDQRLLRRAFAIVMLLAAVAQIASMVLS